MKTFEEFKMALNEKDAGEEDSKTLKSLAKKNMSSKGARRFTKNFDDNTLRSMQAAIGITLAMEWKGPEGSEYSKYNKISDKDVIILLSIVEDVLGKAWVKTISKVLVLIMSQNFGKNLNQLELKNENFYRI